MSRKRILKIAAHNGVRAWGGGEAAQVSVLRGLMERGHEVLLYCNAQEVAARARAVGVECRILRLGGDVAVHHAAAFARELRRRAPDALIVGTYRKLWLAGLAARLAGVPHVALRVDVSGDVPATPKYRFVVRKWIDSVVVVAEEIRRSYLEAIPDFHPARVHTIYNGVRRREPGRTRAEVRRELGVPVSAPLIAGAGRLAPQKRFDRLLEAIARLPSHVHCLIAGDGKERSALEATAYGLGIGARVHMPGFRDDLPDLLSASDVLVISSDFEGLAMVMTEAMAQGVPVVSTPVSGAREALQDGEPTAAGVVVDFDVAEIAAAVAGLLDDPDRRAAMGEAGRRRIRERFGFERMIDRWEEVLSASPRPRGRGGRD